MLRRGTTLLELIVTLVVTGVVLALVAGIGVGQQRVVSDLAATNARSARLREAASILPIDLRGISLGAGDLRIAEARDTAIELRATIATAVICDTSVASIILAPSDSGAAPFASFLTQPQSGDTAWVLSLQDTAESWRPYRVESESSVSGGACAAGAPLVAGDARSRPRLALALSDHPPLASLVGAPLRITRPVRYSLYHASDGSWQLGERDWNPSNARFNAIQPVVGPLLPPGEGGLTFEYLDSLGTPLPLPLADARPLALIRLRLRGSAAMWVRQAGGEMQHTTRVESTTVDVLLHNRR